MVKPTFLCIGVQKSGTTSLINYLNQNNEIFIKTGESHFFDAIEPTESEIANYENTFETNKLIVGEKTPSYNYLQYAMDRIYNYNSNIKLILILREPISRAFSQYNMNLNYNNKTLHDVNEEQILIDFEKEENIKLSEINSNGIYYINRGKYDEIITYILSKFPKENLFIGISEEIKTNKNIYNDIFKFLGAKPLNEMNENIDTHIMKYSKQIPKMLEKKLYNIYKEHNERLYKILGRRIDIWENYYSKIKSEL